MSMLKLITPHAQDFSEPVAQLIKLSSRGLIGFDRQQFVKRAGAEFAHLLDSVKFAADEIPVHLLAIGSTEFYGANRNGDGFSDRTCERTHDTFRKHARFYRDHANKNPAKSYGLVKLSAWHTPMHRIELLVALNAAQSAADRNGGLVADREMEKLSKQQEIGVSMACRIPFDVCSHCGNKSRTRAEYCSAIEDGGHCKAGGLKRHMGRLLSDGSVLHADNPDPTFFDISHVWRPADRIAYVMGELQKAASHGITSGAELAELAGLTMPYTLSIRPGLPADMANQIKLAYQLAELENQLAPTNYALAFSSEVQPNLNQPPVGQEKFAQILRALADEEISLPLRDFVRLVTNTSEKQANEVAATVQAYLPGIYSRLIASEDLEEKVAHNPYKPAGSATPVLHLWAVKQAADLSVKRAHLYNRMQLAAVRQVALPTLLPPASIEKQAGVSVPALNMATHYALYKLAFLDSISQISNDLPLTLTCTVLQNYIR
jgi:hypothetical protein